MQPFFTVKQALEWAVDLFKQHNCYYGHGTDNAWDEAVALLIYVLNLPPDVDNSVLSDVLNQQQQQHFQQLCQQRASQRIPAAYLTQQTWFAGLPFYVDPRVIIPRSPIAELIRHRFSPFLNDKPTYQFCDLCCGSACIAIAMADEFSHANIDAIDLSPDALAVAQKNVEYHELEDRINLIESDLFSQVQGKQYDLIVSNPPYVNAEDLATMPQEYHHEPSMALGSGDDGLTLTRKILKEAKAHLANDGVLIIEVGNSAVALEQAYPDTPFLWLDFEYGGEGVFVLTRPQLEKISQSA